MHRSAVTAVAVAMLLCGYAQGLRADVLRPQVIYGDDDRKELFELPSDAALRQAADSTAALVNLDQLTDEAPGDGGDGTNPMLGARTAAYRQLPATKFGDMYNLCADEPYREQPSPAFCSGFLVAPDLMVTAGHCVLGVSDCANIAFVFGFGYAAPEQDVTRVAGRNIYHCKDIVMRKIDMLTESDFAVIRLDRAVEGRQPLAFRHSGQVEMGTPLAVIGHPAGLPTKIAGGAAVRSAEPAAFFTANLDTYGGNSGSAVFNAETAEVEGILVRGEQDFTSRAGCMTSYRCDNGDCRGEDVTKATEFAPYVTAATAAGTAR